MKAILFVLSLLTLIIVGGISISKSITFKQECGGYLERASNANTVQIAEKELTTAITYIEKKGLTKGYTSAIYQTPDEDLEFWYNNLITARNELREIPPSATKLEQTNVLIKLRESLMTSSKDGDDVIIPNGISRYPNNFTIGFILTVAVIMTGIMVLLLLNELS